MIPFRTLGLADAAMVRVRVLSTECRNCDLNFLNLIGWHFLYGTEVAEWNDWLLFRFRAGGRLAYLAPVGNGNCRSALEALMADAEALGEPFMLMGVCENTLARLEEALPGIFETHYDRRFTDYIYLRETLSTLTGKKLQPKRNHINKFLKLYPQYAYTELTPADFPECLALMRKWSAEKDEGEPLLSLADEARAVETVFANWQQLGASGGVLRVGGRVVAFTYGSPINYDTFGVCVEKADTDYEGAYALINREFARTIPSSYVYVNREEDLGVEGLRRAKLSYHPEVLLNKHIVTLRRPQS